MKNDQWKKECPIKEEEVLPFVKRHIEACGLGENATFDVTSTPHTYWMRVFLEEDDEKERLVSFDVVSKGTHQNITPFGMELSNIDVPDPSFRRSMKLGAVMFKAALAITHARGKTYLALHDVGNDGRFVWPYYGSVPIRNKTFPPDLWLKFWATERKNMGEPTIYEMETLERLSQDHPFLAWRALSQYEGKNIMGVSLRNRFLGLTSHGAEHLLVPGDPATRAILEKRLGVIPPFPNAVPERLAAKDPVFMTMRELFEKQPKIKGLFPLFPALSFS